MHFQFQVTINEKKNIEELTKNQDLNNITTQIDGNGYQEMKLRENWERMKIDDSKQYLRSEVLDNWAWSIGSDGGGGKVDGGGCNISLFSQAYA